MSSLLAKFVHLKLYYLIYDPECGHVLVNGYAYLGGFFWVKYFLGQHLFCLGQHFFFVPNILGEIFLGEIFLGHFFFVDKFLFWQNFCWANFVSNFFELYQILSIFTNYLKFV